jgi:hypothetical protein
MSSKRAVNWQNRRPLSDDHGEVAEGMAMANFIYATPAFD